MRCPFMLANQNMLRAVVANATPEQRAAARKVATSGLDVRVVRERAQLVVGWLRALGENPVDWGARGNGPRVLELRRSLP